ncbi:MAG: S8 family serine peptidase [Flavobacteriales bacterium]
MNKLLQKLMMAVALAATVHTATAQSQTETDYRAIEAATNLQWQHADYAADGLAGTSANKAYSELLKGKKSTTVVVAIIDSGTETFHPDLKDNIWTNADEIPDNGVDDDKNGYVDDIHGWSFIGGAGGDVEHDNLEFTRIYKELKNKYEKKDASTLSGDEKKEYARYVKMKADYDQRMKKAQEDEQLYSLVKNSYEGLDKMLTEHFKKADYTKEELQAVEGEMKEIAAAMLQLREAGLPDIFPEWKDQVQGMVKYNLNLTYDPRSKVGDNYRDSREKDYGNNHIDGPHADHGTHVGGIVGAVRNAYGMDGIADNVRLMVIRCVPNGDERDKDVANAIRYAADNGARIINMSFGKSFSPQKDVVDEAVKYAESKGVLMVHAAGNDNKNIDTAANFPTDKYNDGTFCGTWLEVGASGQTTDQLAASFSNYGKKNVDLFSPGVEIFSTVPGDKYKPNDGTSMASPVAAGVAAVLMSYYPELSAADIKVIMMQSAQNYGKMKVPMPGNDKKKVKFKKLSVTGGVVNLYNALKLAETWKK